MYAVYRSPRMTTTTVEVVIRNTNCKMGTICIFIECFTNKIISRLRSIFRFFSLFLNIVLEFLGTENVTYSFLGTLHGESQLSEKND